MLSLVQDALRWAGHTVTYQSDTAIGIKGGKLSLQLGQRRLDAQSEWLLCARALHQKGEAVYDIPGFGRAVEGLLSVDDTEACALQQALLEDDLQRMLLILQLLSVESTDQVLAALPDIACRTVDIPCEIGEKSRVLAELLLDTYPGARGGLEAQRQSACAHIMPDPVLPLLRVTAYARSAENAQELCDLFNKRIRTTLRQEKNGRKDSSDLQ